MNHDLDKISLPQGSRNQELETLSKRVFEPLFDVELFILKDEIIDNGIDYRCEIKHNGNPLGFGFNFQLKSKEESKSNGDGSFSKSLKTSNIEYLLNNGQPAFYGFYVVEDDAFYYEYLDEFISKLNSENPNWQEQSNHTLRFTKKLDKTAVDLIYTIVLKKGKLFRKVNATLAVRFSQANLGEKVLIDYDGNVSTDEEIKDIIEKYGLELVNQCKWNEVLELHKKTSNGLITSAVYNIAVGLANYYLGEYVRAVSFFKNAFKQQEGLDIILLNQLIFVNATVKYLLQMFTEEEYETAIKSVPEDNHIKFYIQLEKAKEYLKDRLFRTKDLRVKAFEETIKLIIDNADASSQVKFSAKSEFLIYEGDIVLFKYKQTVCRINAHEVIVGPDPILRNEQANLLESEFIKIESKYKELYKEAESSNNYFAFFHLFTNKVKYDFTKYSSFEILKVEKAIIISTDTSSYYHLLLTNIEKSINYFKSIGHIENQLFSQSIKYEILHYLNKIEEADAIMILMEETIEILEIKKLKQQVSFLKNGGTNHQTLQGLLNKNIYHPQKEIELLTEELKEMDSKEKRITDSQTKYFTVELFPIGCFLIPREKKDYFYEIFNITDNSLKEKFDYFFNLGITPRVNSYVFPIKEEGFLNGNLEYTGVESFRKMYNARKAFYENKFYRINHS